MTSPTPVNFSVPKTIYRHANFENPERVPCTIVFPTKKIVIFKKYLTLLICEWMCEGLPNLAGSCCVDLQAEKKKTFHNVEFHIYAENKASQCIE